MTTRRLEPGMPAPPFDVLDIGERPVRLQDFRGRRFLLSFFREAGCPFCNMRVYELTQKHPLLERAGFEIVAIFSSPEEEIRRYVALRPRPFVMIADPMQHLYRLYRTEHSAAKAWWGVVRHFGRMVKGMTVAPIRASRDSTIVPADFLIDEEGIIRDVHYGRDIGDHMSLSRLYAFAHRL